VSRARAAALVAALSLLGAGCSGVKTLSFPTPPSTAPTTTPATIGDLTKVSTAAVAGQTVTTMAMGPGGAGLSGTVAGPDGPVGGADVHVERLVGDGVAAADVVSGADGTWSLAGILGGRYRVRAWRPPDLAVTTPQILFLAATGSQSLALRLDQFGAAQVASALAPDPPVVGQPAGLAVQITVQTVDASGVVRPHPVAAAAAELANGLGWTVTSPNPTTTGATGRATWQLTCDGVGPQSLAVIINDSDVYALNLSACVAPAPPTTTTTTGPGSTTTSTAVTPGTGTPGTVIPGTVIPGTVIPGTVTPGAVTPGAVTPGTEPTPAPA
jgi:hypothetical protein